VLLLREIDQSHVAALLARYGLDLRIVGEGSAIPGSYWGEPEAGLVGHTVFARADTPVAVFGPGKRSIGPSNERATGA